MSEQVTKTTIPATVEEGESIAAGLYPNRVVVLDLSALLEGGKYTYDSTIDVTGTEVTLLLFGEEIGGDQDAYAHHMATGDLLDVFPEREAELHGDK
jgi:hypothetical protein